MPSIAIRRNHKKKVSWRCDRNINIHPHEINARLIIISMAIIRMMIIVMVMVMTLVAIRRR